MHYKELTGKPYLGALDIPEDKKIKLTIKDCYREAAFNPSKRKEIEIGVMEFEGKTLKMIVNATKSKLCAKAFGNDSKQWIGKEINLSRGETSLMGKMVPCIIIEPIGVNNG